jgi:type II secretory pathway pseudopilin PulG
MNRRRGGMTLIEIIVAMTIATAMIGLLAAAVSRVMMASAAAHEHLRTVVTLGRLGEQFRRDAHASHRSTVDASNDQAARLTLEAGPNRTVEYEITPQGLRRVASTADKATQRELFVLPGMKFLGWKSDEDSRFVSLVIGRLARPGSEDPTLGGRFSIDASLAKVEPQDPSL